jgi:high-affinity iron transporter
MTELAGPFFSSFFIILREGFEAMLIAMLVFMFLDKMNARHQRPAVFWGMAGGVVVSLFLAIGFKKIHGITGAHQELFEGSVMLIASGMLAYCALFCHNAKEHVEGKVDKAIDSGNSFILSFTVFLAIIREGFEVVLFYAALFTTGVQSTQAVITGALIGLLALVGSYYGLSRLTKLIPIGTFFRVSAVFLLIMSAYFGYEGMHELVEGLEHLKVL